LLTDLTMIQIIL